MIVTTALDDMVHFETKLSELESKGTSTGSTSVAKNTCKEKLKKSSDDANKTKKLINRLNVRAVLIGKKK